MTLPTEDSSPDNESGGGAEPDLKQEVGQLVASQEAQRSLRKAARVAAAGFPIETDQATRRRLSPVAVRACGKLAAAWGLEPQELAGLLAMTPEEYHQAREASASVVLNQEQFDRAGLLIEIFITLVQLFIGKLAFEWPSRPNQGELFGGLSAIELMQRGGVASMRDVLGHLLAMALGL